MKFGLLGAWLYLLFCTQAWCTERVVIEADDDYAPYSYVDKGQLRGIYVDFLREVAKELAPEYEVSLQAMPWKRGLKNLETGDSLALLPPYKIQDRVFIQPYSTPLYRETVVLFCNEGVMTSPRKVFPADFAGLTIGVNLGFALSDSMNSAKRNGVIKTKEAKGNELNILKLAQGAIDCYANDRLSVIHSVKGLRARALLRDFKLIEVAKLSGEDAYIGYSAANMASYKTDFIAKMNSAVDSAKKAGVLAKFISAYAK